MRFFDRCFEVREPARTAGMGVVLSICRQIANLPGGILDTQCRIEGGARSIVALPAGPAAPSRTDERPVD